jgi:hypothetical protein
MLRIRHSPASLILVMFERERVWKFPWEEIFQMSRNLSATGFAGALLVAVAVIPSAADELFIPYQAVQLPDAGVLGAFDISFVDPESRTLGTSTLVPARTLPKLMMPGCVVFATFDKKVSIEYSYKRPELASG